MHYGVCEQDLVEVVTLFGAPCIDVLEESKKDGVEVLRHEVILELGTGWSAGCVDVVEKVVETG